jgi:diguanylate cyclase (GGDEF)-like protein/PAS domain S-box-containing protein
MRTIASGYASERGCLRASVLRCVPVLLLFSSLAISQAGDTSSRLPILRTIHDVFLLTKAQAAQAYPIELDAVVTYSDPEWGLLFVQDATGTTFINVHGNITKFSLGSRIRITAFSSVGYVGPAIGLAKILVLGTGVLPNPEQLSVAKIDAGEGEAHRVVTEGILHPCDRDFNRVCFRICDGQKALWIMVPEQEGPAEQSLIGAIVRVKGIVGRHEDEEHKRLGAQLYVNTLKEIEVETPPVPVSFSSSPTPIQSLRASDADQRFAGRIHLRGTVTWQSPGLFSIEDDTGTVFVGTGKTAAVQTGSAVDAVGFPSHGPFGLELADSTVSLSAVQSNAANIAPLQLTAADVVKRSLNGRRVRLKARLISQSANATEFVYQLEEGAQRFNAILLRSAATHDIVGLSRDSVLEVTGVALIQSGSPEWPESLLILIESPRDIVVRGGNGWLTLRRGLTIVGLMALCVIVPLIWVTSLRRTVRQQTAMIRARLESELHLETKYSRLFERNLAAVFSWRPDGTIVDCNLAFARMLGLEAREDLIGRSYWDFHVDPDHREQLTRDLQEEALSNREVSLRRDDGTTVHLLKNITPVHTAEGMLYETTAIDVTQLRQNQAELQRARDAAVYESLNDPLTGLPNRKLLTDTLSSLLALARRESGMIALLYLDLDGFKLVNDSLGHAVGDGLLVQLAGRLRSSLRDGDMLARLGGDEFMVVMHGLHTREQAVLLAGTLLKAISNPFEVKGHQLAIGASIGISVFPEDATDAEELIQQADSAMFVGKREGRNRVVAFTPEIGSEVHERLTLEHLLRGAVARNEITLHYQPEFELAGLRLTRFEALARWTHPTLGQIPPLKFIPIAEESGMIAALGAYLMEQACTEAIKWQKMAPYPVQVAVNVSSVQFRRKGFVEEVSAVLERTGLRPELLQIEITESAMLGGIQQAADVLYRLREMGISMAIDDFGTGYSNLSYLPSLAFDTLKIDRSFVVNLDTQPETESMIRTLITLAHNFGMRVIVEGVETQEQLALIKAFGANEVQGYLTGRPTANPAAYMLLPTSLRS